MRISQRPAGAENTDAKEKAIPRTGRPLTIACHMKKSYFFFVVSAIFLAVSTILAAVSILALAVSAILAAVSVMVALESALDSEPEPLQAANAPIAKTKKSFFI